jgi:hypothetical protein
VRWLSGRKRRFAKALYPKRVPRVRIPASPLFLNAFPLLEPIGDLFIKTGLTVPFPFKLAYNRCLRLKLGTSGVSACSLDSQSFRSFARRGTLGNFALGEFRPLQSHLRAKHPSYGMPGGRQQRARPGVVFAACPGELVKSIRGAFARPGGGGLRRGYPPNATPTSTTCPPTKIPKIQLFF